MWLKTTHISYPAVSVDHESWHGFAGFSVSGFLTGCNKLFSQAGVSYQDSSGKRSTFKLTRLLEGFGFSRVVELRALLPCWLLAGGPPQFHVASPDGDLLQQTQQGRDSAGNMEVTVLCNPIPEVTFRYFCCSLLVGSKWLGQCTVKGRRSDKNYVRRPGSSRTILESSHHRDSERQNMLHNNHKKGILHFMLFGNTQLR